MRSESVRLRLPKGKSLFISAAIATLIAQPLNMTLSSSAAFAATNSGDFTVAQEESETPPATVTIKIPDGPNENGVYSGAFNIEGTATAPKNSTLESVSHTFTINSKLGGNPTIHTEVREIVNGLSSTASFEFDSLGLKYPDGTYTITHTATYSIIGEIEDRTDFSTTDPIEIDNRRPNADIVLPTTPTGRTFSFTINATPQEGDTIERIAATLYKVGDSEPRQTFTPENEVPQSVTVTEDGIFYITYEAFATGNKSSLLKRSNDFNITTATTTDPEDKDPVEPTEPTDPIIPVDPNTPADPTVQPEEELRNEDEESEDDEDKDDIEDTLLGAATFSTGLVGNADPFFTEIIGGPTIPLDSNSQDQDSEDDGSTSSTSTNTAEVDERGVVQFLGISWYWWVAMIAGAASLWSLVIAGRNRMTGGDL